MRTMSAFSGGRLPPPPRRQRPLCAPLLQDVDHSRWALTAEAQGYLVAGSPEAQAFAAVPPEGITLADLKVLACRHLRIHCRSLPTPCAGDFQRALHLLPTRLSHIVPCPQAKLGAVGQVGFQQAMQLKWVGIDKSGGEARVVRKAADAQDRVRQVLAALAEGRQAGASDAELAALRKRKLLVAEAWKTYRVGKGPAFALQRKKAATELTAEMLQKWVAARVAAEKGGECWWGVLVCVDGKRRGFPCFWEPADVCCSFPDSALMAPVERLQFF